MITITKEDAEFLAGFIDQWLPICGEKTAERARAVKTKLQAFVAMSDLRGRQADSESWRKILAPHLGKPIHVSVEGVVLAGGGGMGANVIVTGPPERLYDGKAIIAAIEGGIANGAKLVPEYDMSDFAVSPITDDDEDDDEGADDYICPCCIPDSEDDDQ